MTISTPSPRHALAWEEKLIDDRERLHAMSVGLMRSESKHFFGPEKFAAIAGNEADLCKLLTRRAFAAAPSMERG